MAHLFDLNSPSGLRDAVAYLLDKDGGPPEHQPQTPEEAEARGLEYEPAETSEEIAE